MRNLVILGVAALAYGAYRFGNNKIDSVRQTIQSLQIRVGSISNLGLADGGVRFNTNLTVTNPTNQALNLNAQEVVKISKIRFFTDTGQFLGESNPNITGIQIGPLSTITVRDIPTFVRVSNFGALLNNAIGLFLDPNKLKIKTELTALGRTYTI